MKKYNNLEKQEDIKLMDLPLSKRLKDSLSRLGIKTLCDIRKIEEEGFRRINDMGYKSINELKEKLKGENNG